MILRNYSLRQVILALVFIGMVGLTAELLLLGHTDSLAKWVPLIALIAGMSSGLLVALRPSPRTIRIFQVVMVLFIVAGVLGLYFHYRGNVEFALERSPSASSLRLFWKALTGASPTLAPGALAQLGLLGLAYTYHHPGGGQSQHGRC